MRNNEAANNNVKLVAAIFEGKYISTQYSNVAVGIIVKVVTIPANNRKQKVTQETERLREVPL